MASQGPNYGATITTEAVAPESANDWTTPGNVAADDAAEATITAATFDSPDISYRIKVQGLGFALPAGSTIDGIVVEIDRRSIIANSGKDYRVQLLDAAGALVGDNKAVPATIWPTASTVATYGSSSDTWTASPTEAMVEDPDFGVVLSAQANIANADIGVDFIRVTVYYTAPAPSISADPGSYAVTGFAATTAAGRLLPGGASPGSYATTGFPVTLAKGFQLSADPGAYAVTGLPATLLAARVIDAAPGSYAVVGFSASLLAGRALPGGASPGSYAVVGFDATLVKAGAGITLAVDPGSYVVTGFPANVLHGRVLVAESGAYAVVGFEIYGGYAEAPLGRPWYPLWDPWKYGVQVRRRRRPR